MCVPTAHYQSSKMSTGLNHSVAGCRSALNSSFEQDYLDMLTIFKSLPSKPDVRTMTVCPLWNGAELASVWCLNRPCCTSCAAHVWRPFHLSTTGCDTTVPSLRVMSRKLCGHLPACCKYGLAQSNAGNCNQSIFADAHRYFQRHGWRPS